MMFKAQLVIFLFSSPSGTEHCHEEAKEEERSLLCMAALRGHKNFVRFLVESQNAHIEELGTVAVRGILVPGVRALWCASIKGHYRIVEFLLSKGANPNGVTTFESSPLRAACEQGHLHTVRLLVQHGAHIDATNESSVTSLMIASFYGYLEIVKCLLDAGADVNNKNKNGKSALHYCSEAGHVEVMKALLDHNALMDADSTEIKPLLVASSRGYKDMVEYLVTRDDLITIREKIDALELLGASLFIETEDMVTTINYWTSAMSKRYVNGALIYPKSEDNLSGTSQEDFSEVTTLQELEDIELDPEEIHLQSLLVMERVLGSGHMQTMTSIREMGFDYVDEGAFKMCIDLWVHAIDTQRNHLHPLKQSRMFHFESFVGLFAFMANSENARIGNYNPREYFDDFMCVFDRVVIEIELFISSLSNADDHVRMKRFMNIALHLLLPFIRIQPGLTKSQWETVKEALYKLVKLNPRNSSGSTLLHMACSRNFMDVEDSIIPASVTPKREIVDLLLETGCDPSATDHEGNTPLHELAMNKVCPKDLVDALLSGGAHLDAMNSQGQTFASLRASRGQPVSQLVNVVRHTSLQCLAAASIRRHGIPYKDVLPSRLVKFVDMH
ncbi:protein fem-1 homolog C-like [Macrobrachium nipponense]|uniref:protein fem-1 homolog C-like n=1 Tax=Macrobrachium nipponense TaxID=159736 RepID=UPI0030C829AC